MVIRNSLTTPHFHNGLLRGSSLSNNTNNYFPPLTQHQSYLQFNSPLSVYTAVQVQLKMGQHSAVWQCKIPIHSVVHQQTGERGG